MSILHFLSPSPSVEILRFLFGTVAKPVPCQASGSPSATWGDTLRQINDRTLRAMIGPLGQ